MRNYVQRLSECKLGNFFIKYHIFYLILPIALWGFKALSYNIAIWLDPPTRYFHIALLKGIDSKGQIRYNRHL